MNWPQAYTNADIERSLIVSPIGSAATVLLIRRRSAAPYRPVKKPGPP